ncbi:MAG: hypothetical protein CDV28_1174 [Candidatus Electronema aureum]|uniref:Uncharacterized protein n=1 Tax=Candidatus Electronema aureum TaxID=2005002 RepID=A0A521G164_9BACT|nr:MAG: hypothetical protein CDV28_1174 [Candidatus Electronema aureum]
MSDNSFSDASKYGKKSADQSCTTDSEDLSVTNRDSENDSIEQNINADESVKPLSEEEGLNAAKSFLDGNEEVREDKEFATFLRYLVKFSKKARELGIEGLFSTTTIYNQGGNHFSGCDVGAQNIVGHNQKIGSAIHGDDSGKHIEERSDSSIEEIFDEHENVKDRSFMIALAVLEGCNYRYVLNTSRQLQSILQPKEKTENDLDIRVNEKKRSTWLKEIRAYLSDGEESTECGQGQIDIVSFQCQEDSSTLLRYIWHEYDAYADALLQWLYELGEHSSADVRSRAAGIAGQLAIYEFRPVREKIFLPWAKSEKQSLQRLTALALSIVASYDENEKIAQQAFNILHHWSGLKNSFRLNSTAIVAYGHYIGLLFPQQALDNLKIIAQSGDGRLFSDIAQAVVKLFDIGEKVSERNLIILNTLKEWIKQHPKTSLHKLSLIIFWRLMRKSNFANNVQRPVLLLFSKEEKQVTSSIVFLIRNSLNIPLTSDLTIQAIRSWVDFVDKQQEFYEIIAIIIFNIAKTEGEKRRICSYLSIWSRTSNIAVRLLDLMKRSS